MKQSIFFLFLLVFMVACSSDKEGSEGSDPAIEVLEKEVEAEPNAENSKALLDKYSEFVAANPESHDVNSRYLYRAASLQYRMNRFSGAINLLKQALKDHYTGDNTANNVLLLGSIFKEKLNNEEGASTTYQCFIEAFPNNEKTASVKADYGNLPDFETRLLSLGNKLMNDSTHRIDYRVANDFVNVCELHALILPNDGKAGDYLHKAGETARSIRSFDKALNFYDWICTKYPEHPKAPQALFLQAFTYDNDKKDIEKARTLYTAFLEKYPNDDFADDTKFLLDNLGKDDEEIIQSFGKEVQ
ncbi:MAG: tetratricopeptide repeat protein [Saprospiraceae bacterium]|nr:tetratricopeptide repeat protein [Saprospiraceae bacterium]